MIGTPLRVIVPHGTVLPKIPAPHGVAGLDKHWPLLSMFLLLLLLWIVCPALIHNSDPTADMPNQGLWMLVILSLIVFFIILSLCCWLFDLYWKQLRLPAIPAILSHFKNLSLWQQTILLWVSFAMLLLVALGCLMSIC